jgi:hypothetical protein
MYKTIIGVVLMLVIALVVQLYELEQQRIRIVAQRQKAEQAQAELDVKAYEAEQARLKAAAVDSQYEQVEDVIVPELIRLPSGSPKEFPIDVNLEQMLDVTVSGHFDASSGGKSGIEVFIFTEDDYTNWLHGTDSVALYASGRKAVGDMNVRIVRPGRYYLVFQNSVSSGEFDVKTGIRLRYEKPVHHAALSRTS